MVILSGCSSELSIWFFLHWSGLTHSAFFSSASPPLGNGQVRGKNVTIHLNMVSMHLAVTHTYPPKKSIKSFAGLMMLLERQDSHRGEVTAVLFRMISPSSTVDHQVDKTFWIHQRLKFLAVYFSTTNRSLAKLTISAPPQSTKPTRLLQFVTTQRLHLACVQQSWQLQVLPLRSSSSLTPPSLQHPSAVHPLVLLFLFLLQRFVNVNVNMFSGNKLI